MSKKKITKAVKKKSVVKKTTPLKKHVNHETHHHESNHKTHVKVQEKSNKAIPILIGLGIISLIVILLFVFMGPSENLRDEITNESASNSNVLAKVEGEEITVQEVREIQDLFAMQGMEVSQKDAIDQLISMKVLESVAKDSGFSITTQEALLQIEEELSIQGSSIDEIRSEYENLNRSFDDEVENYRLQIMINNLIENHLDNYQFTVTEEEIVEIYQMYQAQFGENITLEEIRPDLEQVVLQEKQQEVIGEFIGDLVSNADVVIY